jgi:hypothetical protein
VIALFQNDRLDVGMGQEFICGSESRRTRADDNGRCIVIYSIQ